MWVLTLLFQCNEASESVVNGSPLTHSAGKIEYLRAAAKLKLHICHPRSAHHQAQFCFLLPKGVAEAAVGRVAYEKPLSRWRETPGKIDDQ